MIGRTSRSRRWRYAALGLLVVAALVLVLQRMAELPFLRQGLTDVASAAVGHPVTLEGPVRVTLLPHPALEFERVRVLAAHLPATPVLLRADRIVVQPVLSDLLAGALAIQRLALEGVEVFLEWDAAGRSNWQAGDDSVTMPSLDALVGRAITVHYRGGRAGRGEVGISRFEGGIAQGRLTAAVEARSSALGTLVPVLEGLGIAGGEFQASANIELGLEGPIRISDVVLRGHSLSASGDLTLPRRGGVPALDAHIRIEAMALPAWCGGPGRQALSGRIESLAGALSERAATVTGWHGTIAVDIGRLDAGEFAFTDVALVATGESGGVTFGANAGADSGTLEVRASREAGPDFAVEVRAGAATASRALDCAGLPAEHGRQVSGIHLQAGIRGRTAAEVLGHANARLRAWSEAGEHPVSWGLAGVDIRATDGRLDSFELDVSDGTGGTVIVSGSGGPLEGLLQGDWPFEAEWVERDANVKVSGRLTSESGGITVAGGLVRTRRADAAAGALIVEGGGQWRFADEVLSFTALDLAVGGNRLQGNVRLDVGAQPMAVSGHLALGRTDFDWLVSLVPEDTERSATFPDFVVDALRIEIGGLDGLPVGVGRFEAQVHSRNHEMRLDPLRLQALSGQWTGRASVDMSNAAPETRFELTADRISAPTSAGGEVPLLMAISAEGVDVRGRFTGRTMPELLHSLAVDASSRRMPVTGLPAGFDAVVVEDVVARLRPDAGLSASARAGVRGEEVSLSLTATPADDGWRLVATAAAAAGRLRVEAPVQALAPDAAGGPLDVTLGGEDVARLLALLDVSPGGLTGPYAVRARLSREGAATVAAPLEASLDAVGTLRGEARFDSGDGAGAQQIVARLESERLDLSAVLPAGAPPSAPAQRVIPNARLPRVPDLPVRVEVMLKVAEVVTPRHRLLDLAARLESRPGGRFAVRDARAALESGATIAGALEARAEQDGPHWSLSGDARGVDPGTLVPGPTADAPLAWPAHVTVEFEGRGNDVYEVLGRGNGTLRVEGGKTAHGTEDFSAWELNLLRMMLPGLGEAGPSRLNCAVLDTDLAGGVLTTKALLIDAQNVTIAGTGTLDLRTESIDFVLAPRPRNKRLLSTSTPVEVKGTLSAPTVSLATGALVASTGTLLVGAINPYLLLGSFVPVEAGEPDTCAKALERARAAPDAVAREAEALEETHSSPILDLMTAPLEVLGRGLGGRIGKKTGTDRPD